MEKTGENAGREKSDQMKKLEKMIAESGFKFGQYGSFNPVFGPAQGDARKFTFTVSDTTCSIR
ncbi:MAG: hypothetical protein KIG68_09455 [Oxalobacter sp.]|nr:hypothetical protein [Oxalobacter sp.]